MQIGSIMGIEQDIKQEKFQSEYQKLFVNIAYTNSFLSTILSNYLKPYKLSMQQYNVLRILRGQYPKAVSINSITDRMIDKMSNASRLVDKLQTKELVERTKCIHDKRQVDIELSTKGLETLNLLDKVLPNFESDFQQLTTAEAKKLNELLDKLRTT